MQRRKFLRTAAVGAAGVATRVTLARTRPSRIDPALNGASPRASQVARHACGGPGERMVKIVAEAPTTSSRIRTFAAGGDLPGLQVLDAVQNGTVDMGDGVLLLLRQGPDLRIRHRRSVGLNTRQFQAG